MPNDVRFVAPVDTMLRRTGLAYIQNRDRYFAQNDLFPWVEFEGYNGTIYTEESIGTLRAEDARGGDEIGFPTISFRGKGTAFMAEDWGFQSLVTNKQMKTSQVPGTGIQARRARILTEKLWLAREVRSEAIVDAVAPTVSLSGTAKWNSTAAVPRTDIMAGKTAILKWTGREGNKLVLSGSVSNDLITRESTGSAGSLIKDAIKYVMQATGRQINEPLIAAYFDVERVRFAKGVQQDPTKNAPSAIAGALPQIGTFIFDQDEAYLVYNEDDPSPETSNYGISPGPMDFGAAQFPDPFFRGIWVQAYQALLEMPAEAKSIYVLGTIL
jgi:hypothetical protein